MSNIKNPFDVWIRIYWLSCSSIAPCQNFARMDGWTGCDKGFILWQADFEKFLNIDNT